MTYHQKNNRGFTLIELLITIAIIGVISGVVFQSFTSARAKSRDATRLTQIDQINKALELGATGGNNKLPVTNSSGDDRVCLGLTANTSPPCGGSFNATNNAVNTYIASNIAGGVIPRDPKFIDGIGTAYLYRSNYTPPALGNCTATSCPPGAYLSWVSENNNCGRGIYYQDVTNGYLCLLRIGDSVTN